MLDKDKDVTKSTGGGYKSGDYTREREATKERSTSVGAGRGASAGGPTTSSERAAASKSGTSSSSKSTGYGESSRTSVADRDRQGLGNVVSTRPTTGLGDPARAPTPTRTTTGLGSTLTPSERSLIQRSGVQIPGSAYLAPAGGVVNEAVISERQLRGTPTVPAVTATRIDPSQELIKLSMEMIRNSEGIPGTDVYNTVFGGKQHPLTSMTLGEVMQLQKTLKSTPVGAYQMTKETLPVAAKLAGITLDTVMTKEVQDRLGLALIENRARKATVNGKIDIAKFQRELSKEWAGLADPKTGASHYAGVAGNKATVATDVTREIASDLALALGSRSATAAAAAAPTTTRYDEVYSGKGRSALSMDELVATQLPSGAYRGLAGEYVDPYAAVRPPAAGSNTGFDAETALRDAATFKSVPGFDAAAALKDAATFGGRPIDERALIQSTQLPAGSYRDPMGLDTYAKNADFNIRPEPAAAAVEIPDIEIPASDYDLTTKEGVKEFQRDHDLEVDGIIGPRTRAAIENSPDLPPDGGLARGLSIDPMTTGAVATPAAIPDLAAAPKAKVTLEQGERMPRSSIVDRIAATAHAVLGPGWEVIITSGDRGPGGSGRHNQLAADVMFREIATGRVLDYRKAEDRPVMNKMALTGTGSFGIQGVGIGREYMGGTSSHFDIYTALRKGQDKEWEEMNDIKDQLANARASYASGESYNVEDMYTETAAATEDGRPRSAVEQADAYIAERAAAAATEKTAADTTARAANAAPPAATTTGPGYYSNITQRGLGTNLKPTVPPTGVSADDYKRGLGGDIVGGIIDMAISGSIPGLVMQAGSLLLTGDTVGGAVWDQMHGQGATNYYQPGDLDRQSDSSGEQVRTDPTRRFEDRYLTGSTASTGTTSSPKTTTADPVVTEVPFNDPTVRPKPYEKWGSPTWGKEYA